LRQLYREYIKGREESLIDAAAAAAGISIVVLSEHFDPAALSPQMREAFELAYPHVPIESLSDYSPDQLDYFVSPWKGKLFEVIVRDRLNNGDWVGDIHLEPGQIADLAEHANQPGWDLAIFDGDGSVADQLQLKATTSLHYVKEALELYPDIDILTREEAAHHGPDILHHVIDSGMSEEALHHNVESAMSPLVEHTQHLDWLHDVLPALPFVIILGTEGRRVFMGKASFEKAVASVLERSFISGAAMGVGALIHFLYGGIISLPATVSTRLVLSRFFNFRRLEATLVRKVEIVRVIAAARSPGPRYLSSGIPSGLAGFLPAPICPTL
jgi:hypothetical protein